MHPFVLFIVFFSFSFSYFMFNASSLDDKHQGSNNDRVSLLAFKSKITSDPHRVLDNWNESIPMCRWQGVTCDPKHRRVVSLYFQSKGLVGTLSPFVGNLTSLQLLYLSDNSFQGGIPSQIGKLLELYSLVLEYNSFTGEIPANISRCLKLEYLSLANNHLTGTMPPSFAVLSNLIFLTLQHNKFVGPLLDIVVNMTSLQELSAAYNSFEGTIPHNIGSCKNMIALGVGQNKISEYGLGSTASKEGDVYSYGIVLIEIMTAIRPTDGMFEGDLSLHKHAKLALNDELATIIDPRLVGDGVGANLVARNGRMIDCIKAMIELGVKCSVESPHDRMMIKDVVKELQIIRNKY